MSKDQSIDVVITWVDGNDSAHSRKMDPYLKQLKKITDDLAGPTRFRSIGEINFCVASVLKFAPFVRRIFIITDKQNPNLDAFIQKKFPNNETTIEIVDHSVIFRGYENYLPVFNSLSIETCLYRIPGLSENFVYMNDDFFLIRPVKETDWFTNNCAVCYGQKRSILMDELLRLVKPTKNGQKPFGFKDSMLNAAKILNIKGNYCHIDHTPLALKKSVLMNYFENHPEKLTSNISHRFRESSQFNPQALFYMKALQTGECVLNSTNKLLYIKPVNRGKSYVRKKLMKFENDANLLFCCIGSLDLASENDQEQLFDWLKKILDLESV